MRRDVLIYLFALSLAGHFGVLKFFSAQTSSSAKNKSEFIQVTALDVKDLEKISARQIIELPQGPDEEPEKAKYLSERAVKAEQDQMGRPAKPAFGHSSPLVPNQSIFKKKSKNKDLDLVENLKPDISELVKYIHNDEAGCIDFLEGAVLGEITFASAYKFKYAQFFNQLKRSIAFYWNPLPALMLIPKPTSDLITRIRFTLDERGFLKKQEVIASSGYKAVDRSTLKAIQNATPVFWVPKELLDENNELSLVCEFRIVTSMP